jgi:RNA-binding protein NOB1
VSSSDAELAEQLESLVVDDSVEAGAEKDEGEQELEPLGVVLEPIPVEAPEDSAPASSVSDAPTPTPPAAIVEPPATEPPATEPPATEHSPAGLSSAETVYDDPSDSDDGEGEWITPSNVAVHKSRALHLLPSATAAKGKEPAGPLGAGCMTADFAMQNVLLQMGLNLVGLEGKRIDRVKTWVLRCHACFKYVLFV